VGDCHGMRGSGSVVRLCAHRLVRVGPEPSINEPAAVHCEAKIYLTMNCLEVLDSDRNRISIDGPAVAFLLRPSAEETTRRSSTTN